MKRLGTQLTAVTLLLCVATAAFAANHYPPGPAYRSCPDTLRIFDLEQVDTLVAPCHPAKPDTVLGVGGIVIAFDAKPSAFAVYFQTTGGGAWTGVQAFTGATNYNAAPYSLALGDSIVVYGTMQEFPDPNGTTEIEGPDGLQTSNDIVIRKVSSGNALPPFKILNTHEINWIPGSETPAPRQEPWEQCLVRVRGPVHVGRTSLQGGQPPLPFNSFLVVSNALPTDSVLVEGNLLTTVTPPAVGTVVDSVQGIVIQNTTTGVNSYRVSMRSSNDLFASISPNLAEAYPISDALAGQQTRPLRGERLLLTSNETLRLVFDKNVDVTTAQNAANYHLASEIDGSTVDAATVEGGSGPAVLLDVTSVRARGDGETVTASGIGSSSCPSCLMSQQSQSFINGVLSPADVQAPDPDSLIVTSPRQSILATTCTDRSRFAGTGTSVGPKLAVRGVGVGIYGSLQYLEKATGGQRSGLSVFGPSAPLTRGHDILIAGQIQEFGGETELVFNTFLKDFGFVGEPAPVDFSDKLVPVLKDSTCDAAQNITNGEDYEGVLVHVSRVMVTEHRTTGQSWFVADISGGAANDTILVSNLNGVLSAFTPPDSGTIIDVKGILHFASGTFRICPREAGDISSPSLGVGDGGRGLVALRAYPNPARSTHLRFSVPRRDDVHLAVYDLLGRQIAVIAKGRFEPGVYSREWNGRDAAGRDAGAGVYLFRLKVGKEVRDVRGVRLK
ncbi:MAG TPA: T9SS type A sorting domain-containing protein [Candidatus Eisenbacteria bacterium]